MLLKGNGRRIETQITTMVGWASWCGSQMRIMATIYSEIYIIGSNDGKIGRKYAILITIIQSVDLQQVIKERRESQLLA